MTFRGAYEGVDTHTAQLSLHEVWVANSCACQRKYPSMSRGTFSLLINSREGANREKLTVKKIINNEMFFSPFMSLINRERLCVNREKSAPKNSIFSPLVFHRLRLLEIRIYGFCLDIAAIKLLCTLLSKLVDNIAIIEIFRFQQNISENKVFPWRGVVHYIQKPWRSRIYSGVIAKM